MMQIMRMIVMKKTMKMKMTKIFPPKTKNL